MPFLPVGTVRTFTCQRCGDVYTETWVEPKRSPLGVGFLVRGVRSDGSRVPDDVEEGCRLHPTHPGPRGPHTYTVEVSS